MKKLSASLVPLALLYGITDAANATLAYYAHVDEAIYTSIGISASGAFSAGTWLNPPIQAAGWLSSTPNGTTRWNFSSPTCVGSCGDVYSVDVARRGQPGAVDTLVLRSPFPPDVGACSVFGFHSGGSGVPAWNYTVAAPCLTDYQDIGGAYQILQMADGGRTAAFAAVSNASDGSGAQAMKVWALDAQTGALLFVVEYADRALAPTEVQVAGGGGFVLHTVWHQDGRGTVAYVYERDTGRLRGSAPAFPFSAAISDDGALLAAASLSGPAPQVTALVVQAWNGSAYAPVLVAPLPNASGAFEGVEWWPDELALSTDDASGLPLAVLATTTGTHSVARVTAFQLLALTPPFSSRVAVDWLSQVNSDGLANIATVRVDGAYIAVALYGDKGEAGAPTAVLLHAGGGAGAVASQPVWRFVSEGSLSAVDIVASGGGGGGAVVAFAGKATNAGIAGAGGDLFVFDVAL